MCLQVKLWVKDENDQDPVHEVTAVHVTVRAAGDGDEALKRKIMQMATPAMSTKFKALKDRKQSSKKKPALPAPAAVRSRLRERKPRPRPPPSVEQEKKKKKGTSKKRTKKKPAKSGDTGERGTAGARACHPPPALQCNVCP